MRHGPQAPESRESLQLFRPAQHSFSNGLRKPEAPGEGRMLGVTTPALTAKHVLHLRESPQHVWGSSRVGTADY